MAEGKGTAVRVAARDERTAASIAAYDNHAFAVGLRPDPFLDRKRPWVIALGRVP